MEVDAPAAAAAVGSAEEDELPLCATVTPQGRPPSLLSLSRVEEGGAGAGGGDGEEAIVGVKARRGAHRPYACPRPCV